MLRRLVALLGLTFAALLTVLAGAAAAEGEQIVGTLASGASGPIEGVTVTVTTADGDEVGSDTTDENGRFEIDVPGAGDYVATIDAGDLPEGVTSSSAERPVTVGPNRAQRVAFALSDGSVGQGGGDTITVLQRFVEGLRFGLIIAIPALMFYRYFRGLVDAYTLDLEQASDRMVPHLMRFAIPSSRSDGFAPTQP